MKAHLRGRGSAINPENRFETLHLTLDDEEQGDRHARTELLHDDTQSVLSRNNSEDLSFDVGLNAYRGCEHGCSYCYARTYHEYLGFSAGLDFESKILVKPRAAELLEKQLGSPRYRPTPLAMSGATDPYQPVERKLELTRACLEVLARFRHPVTIITKNDLVIRDLDLLRELARYEAVAVYLSITSLDPKLARALEPRASSPRARLLAVEKLAGAGIPVGVSAAPMIPGLNDHELAAIMKASSRAGASFGFYSPVRLPGAVQEVFRNWLEVHVPQRKKLVLDRIRKTHDGQLNSRVPGARMRGRGAYASQLKQVYEVTRRRLGWPTGAPALATGHFRRLMPGQGELFD